MTTLGTPACRFLCEPSLAPSLSRSFASTLTPHFSTNDGYFEEASYRYESNASNPSCIQAIIWWQHGTYRLNNNGSISLYPFPSDGRIQVQNPCAAVTNVITYYDQWTQFADWGIIIDYSTGNYQLRLNRFDGAKLPYVRAPS